MINKKETINALDAFINRSGHKLSAEEIQELKEIKDCIAVSKNREEIAKWAYELLKFIAMVREFIDL